MGTSVEKLALSRAWERYRGLSEGGSDEADNPSAPTVGATRVGQIAFATALLALGVRSAISASFIPAWQPVAKSLPFLEVWAAIDGGVLSALAFMVLVDWHRRLAGYGLAVLLSAWIVILQMPVILASPEAVLTWLGVAEVGALAAAALIIGSGTDGTKGSDRGRTALLARIAFGFCAIVFGLSHFAYADFTAGMVPAFLPARLALAYFTGAAHIAAGLAIATGAMARLAARMLTVMTASFVVLIHVPAVIASGGSLAEVTFLFNACAICGAAWTVAGSLRTAQRPRSAADPLDSR